MKTITIFDYYLFSFKLQYSNNSKYHEYLNELNYLLKMIFDLYYLFNQNKTILFDLLVILIIHYIKFNYR